MADDDDDPAFLSALDAVEALHASTSPHPSPNIKLPMDSKRPKLGPEGEYLAALRGTHSQTWKAKMDDASSGHGRSSYPNPVPRPAVGATGSWTSGSKESDDGSSVPVRNCPCGAGACRVLTANTEKNAGRQFYRCPLRQEEGQCSFFEWCDAASIGMKPQNEGYENKQPEIACPCGAGNCAILTAKTEKNLGRQFYKCPLNQGEGSCGFFKWCDEATPDAKGPAFLSRSGEMAAPQSTKKCFTCGMDGHWSNDCPNRRPANFSSISLARSFTGFGSKGTGQGGSGASGTSYKCGQAGHWSKDCSIQQFDHTGSKEHFSGDGSNAGAGRTAKSGSCFACGGEGHWSSNCRNGGNKGFGLNRDTGSDSCYKCGAQGHWSNNCPNSFGGQSQGSRGGTTPAGKTGGSRSCHKCGGQGHWANECRG